MRVIAGNARGRRLEAGRGQAIRPTGAKVKGAIFSILASRYAMEGIDVLDLFAGSGGLGIEALSRGARHVTFVEKDAAHARILRGNLERCGLNPQATVVQAALPGGLRRIGSERGFGGVFLDPPYEKGLVEATLTALGHSGLVAPSGWVVVEHSTAEAVRPAYGALRLTIDRRYGKTALAIFLSDGEVQPPETQR